MRLDDFPRYRLIHAPTPLEPLERLQKFLGGPKLYVKRDDCAGLAFGGNKSRKLEFLLGEALQTGATTLITDGGLQSNHARQTAAAAAKAGLKCHLVLADNVQIKGQTYRSGGNVLLDRLLGADIHFCTHGETRVELIERLILELQARRHTFLHSHRRLKRNWRSWLCLGHARTPRAGREEFDQDRPRCSGERFRWHAGRSARWQ